MPQQKIISLIRQKLWGSCYHWRNQKLGPQRLAIFEALLLK